MSTEPLSLDALAQQWREKRDIASRLIAKAQASPTIEASGYVATGEEAAYNDCADDLDACRASLGAALQELEDALRAHAKAGSWETDSGVHYGDRDAAILRCAEKLADLRTRIGA